MHTPDPKSLGPDARREVERALRLGTFGKIDRSQQYQGPERARPEALLKAVNAQGNYIRSLQAEQDRMQERLMNLKLRNAIIVAAITGAIARGPEIWAWLSVLFR